MNDSKSKILIVDDVPINIRMLHETLKDLYTLTAASSGEKALKFLEKDMLPDLILLDIMMPEMDGYEVCRKIKQNERWANIPVIFISAKAETLDKVKAFEVGGVDYITKPFEPAEVIARVKTHLTIREQERILQRQYEELKQLEIMRETLTNMIVHDLKNPLQSVFSYAELLKIKADKVQKEEIERYSGRILSSSKSILDMIQSILDVAKLEENRLELNLTKFDVREVLEEVSNGLASMLELEKLTLMYQIPDELIVLRADQEIFRRILVNIVGNAIRFSPEQGQIIITASHNTDYIRFMIADEGPGIPDEYKGKIFSKFGQVDSQQAGKKYSTGLGLTFCKMAVEAHGGEIGVEDRSGEQGSVFWFNLPR
jgi:signal transduction histidine kinase